MDLLIAIAKFLVVGAVSLAVAAAVVVATFSWLLNHPRD